MTLSHACPIHVGFGGLREYADPPYKIGVVLFENLRWTHFRPFDTIPTADEK
jgi:hypothetical protein